VFANLLSGLSNVGCLLHVGVATKSLHCARALELAHVDRVPVDPESLQKFREGGASSTFALRGVESLDAPLFRGLRVLVQDFPTRQRFAPDRF
jgi:hypothetical protein